MGNPHKGEVEFTVDKKVYTLHFSINAMCELENALGGSVVEIAAMMSDPTKIGIKTMRTIFWAGLRDHHDAITEIEAGRLMNGIGLADAAQILIRAFTLAFPEAEGARPLPEASAVASTGTAH